MEKAEFDKDNITVEEWELTHKLRMKLFHDIKQSKYDIVNAFKKWPSYLNNHKYVWTSNY